MRYKKHLKWFGLIFIIVLILMIKLFVNVRFYGHDTLFHAGNIINLSETISINNFFCDNLISLSTNLFGYGTWLFYPKLPHLLGAYVYLLFNDVYFSMNLVYFIITFLSGIVMYCLSMKLFKNSKVAFLSSLIYLTCSYHLCEIYTRDAFAENFMFLIVPMIFLALYELKDGNYNKFYILFIAGYVIGMYSHLISMLFCTIFVFLFLVYYRKKFFCKEKLKCLMISTLIVIGLVCPFLVSILEHKLLGEYFVFMEDFSSKNIVISNILPISSYFNHDKDFNYNNILVYFNYSTILLVCVTFIFYLFKQNRNKFKETRKFLIFGILLFIVFINSEYFWYHVPNILSMLQFSWRLMIFLCCAVSLYAPLCFINLFKKKKIYKFIYCILVIVIILEGCNNICYYGEKEYNYEEISQSSAVMGWQLEYLPVNVIEMSLWHFGDYLNDRPYDLYFSDSLVTIKLLEDNFPMLQFEIDNVNDMVMVELPRIYYLGYELYDQNDHKCFIYQTSSGFLGATLYADGIYTLKYEGTIYDKIARVICLSTALVVVIWGCIFVWKKGNRNFGSLL